MALTAGSRLGPYEILSLVGQGGMGEVYRARDSRLGRDVAIKVLPAAFTADPDRLARFEREARILASLHHTNIAMIHGFEQAAGAGSGPVVHAIVMELVEGQTLAERLHTSPSGLPIVGALAIARQIGDALDAAHEKGVVHRDLKPANVKVTSDGTVKVLDFGLAKTRTDTGTIDPTATPTMSGEQTAFGSLLGTAPYMSPEQARGRVVDKRTDIWAFGCVLYELLTGRRAFPGETTSDAIAAVLEREPDWTLLPAATPPTVRRLLQRCLTKDPKRRLRDIGEAIAQLEDVASTPSASDIAVVSRRGWWKAAAGLVVLASLAAVWVAGRLSSGSATDAPETRLHLVMPLGDRSPLAISPDGRTIITEANGQLWLRRLDAETAEPLPGTEGGVGPFWSPDGRSIGFFASLQLKRLDIVEGIVRRVADVPNSRGGSWGADGTILISAGTGPLYKVSASGGSLTELMPLPANHSNYRWPRFLPDGRRFLFFALGTPESRGLHIGSLDGGEPRRLDVDADSAGVFVPPDWIMFLRQGALWAQRLDLDRLKPVGEAVAVARHARLDIDTTALTSLAAAANGTVAYRPDAGERQWAWVDRSGREIGALGAPDPGQPYQMRLSPDGRTVGITREVDGNVDIWLVDAERGVSRRLTLDRGHDAAPVIASDGNRVVFRSDRSRGIDDLYERAVNGTSSDTVILVSSEHKSPEDLSPDGRYLLYITQSSRIYDLWALPLFGDRKPLSVSETPFAELNSRFSPDGQWIAYQSDETGRFEIFVQPFLRPGGKVQVSTGGGFSPKWRRDGRELFYGGPNGSVMAVPVTLSNSAVTVGPAAQLFSMPSKVVGWDVFPDGQRFLVMKIVTDPSPITLLLNWKPPAR